MDGNYRLIIEPEKKKDERNRIGLMVLEFALIVPAAVPAAVVVALLLVALFGRV